MCNIVGLDKFISSCILLIQLFYGVSIVVTKACEQASSNECLKARLPMNNVSLAYKTLINTRQVSYKDGCSTCLAKH